MANIINPQEKSENKIQKFTFDKLDVNEEDIVAFEQNPFLIQEDRSPDSSVLKTDHEKKPETFDTQEREHLLEKIDQLTSDVVRLQMELEKVRNEHTEALEKVRQEAYEQGKEDAIKTLQEENSEEMENLKTQFIRSITLLDEKKHLFDQTLVKLEEELLESAFILAKKVILTEVDKHSAQIASEIAKYLLKNIKESSEVTLHVNPLDHTFVSSQLKESLIKIEADEAVQKGGVVIIGGEENIDGTILTRYKQALQFLQKES